jgi:hypothetical protein
MDLGSLCKLKIGFLMVESDLVVLDPVIMDLVVLGCFLLSLVVETLLVQVTPCTASRVQVLLPGNILLFESCSLFLELNFGSLWPLDRFDLASLKPSVAGIEGILRRVVEEVCPVIGPVEMAGSFVDGNWGAVTYAEESHVEEAREYERG